MTRSSPRESKGNRRVVVFFAAYVAIMSALAAFRWHVWSYGADTGTFTQVATNAFSGFTDTSELGSHFHVHWAPILVCLYPFVALTHSGLAIQIVQIVAIGLGIFPFSAFVRRYVDDDATAATIASLALIYPPLLAVAFDEFHEIAFYPALVFALLWAIDAGRFAWACVVAALILLVREEALIVVAVFGIVLAVATLRAPRAHPRGLLFLEPYDRRRSFALGASLAVAAPIVFATYFYLVAPALGGWTASHFYDYPFAHGPRALVAAFATHPLEVVRALVTPGRATYLLEAFAPLLFFALPSRWMFVVVPGLAVVVLSSDASAWRMGNHYAGLWAPWLLVATVDTFVRIARARTDPRRSRRLERYLVASCAIVLVAFDPLHPGHYLRAPYADLADARRAFATVPLDASVFTHDEWFAHVAGMRPQAEHVWNEPDYVVLADDFPHAVTFAPFMRLQVARGCYAVERRLRSVVVYRRTSRATVAADCRIQRSTSYETVSGA